MCCLNDLYNTRAGRLLLRPLISKPVSDIAGFFLDCRISKLFIKPFALKNHIALEDYEIDDIKCFNDFFRRKIKKGLRPVSDNPSELIAPCDGLLKVSRINRGSIIEAKQSRFTIRGMLRDIRLADSFDGGYCLVYRLCVDNYHRYIYFDSGRKYKNRHIRGIYHTVRPVALDVFPVFVRNTREYAVIDTCNFGRCVQMEVGAMLVGRIVNHRTEPCRVSRGTEKGFFEYGGSTVIVLIPKQELTFDEKILKGMREGSEIPVKMGETIAVSGKSGM